MTGLDLSTIVTEHGAFVWRVLRHLGVHEQKLDDVSQEVFMVLLERPDAFRGASSMRTFLYGICRNLARAARRPAREQTRDELPERAAEAQQELSLVATENRARLVAALAELSDEQRMLIVLYEIEEVSMEEIALSLRIPLRTCYSRLEAARKQLEMRFRRRLLVAQLSPREVLE